MIIFSPLFSRLSPFLFTVTGREKYRTSSRAGAVSYIKTASTGRDRLRSQATCNAPLRHPAAMPVLHI